MSRCSTYLSATRAALLQVAPFVPTPAAGWWGAKQFASAGLLEGSDEAGEHVKKEREAFNEDDQEQLYHKAQVRGYRAHTRCVYQHSLSDAAWWPSCQRWIVVA